MLVEHRDLLPELAERLCALRLIESARKQARTPQPDESSGASPAAADPALSIPGFEIFEEIHRGGQGVVYRAIQKSTRRQVAIKVMHQGPMLGPQERHRFEREVRLLAQLRHPSIVAIHDSGQAAGGYYFIMDFVRGQPLDIYVASQRWSVRQTLILFARVCDAVAAAHVRGILHRDLKPSNILVDEHGEPRVLDFGLAKVASEDEQATRWRSMTATGQFVGSLPWASPEQADGIPEQIDLRADVYSLGVVLFQVLTGQFPYGVAGRMREVLASILEAEPSRPKLLRKDIDDEVETIILKCLAKEPQRRYETAGALARDIDRYLSNEPIEAKRDSTLYVLRKQVRRYRIPLLVAAGFVVVLIASSIVAWSLYLQSQQRLWDSYLAQAHATRMGDKPGRCFDALDALAKAAAIRPSIELRNETIAAMALTDVRIIRKSDAELFVDGPTTFNETGDAYYSYDDRTGRTIVRRFADNEAILLLTGPPRRGVPRFSRDGRYLACASDGGCDVWDLERGLMLKRISHDATRWGNVYDFSHGDRELAIATLDGSIHIHGLASNDYRVLPPVHASVGFMRYHPAENVLATASLQSGDVLIRNAQTGDVLQTLHHPGDTIYWFDWSPKGEVLAASCDDLNVYVWDLRTGRVQFTLRDHMNVAFRLDFDPTGSLLLTSSWDGLTRLYDPRTGVSQLTVPEMEADHFLVLSNSTKFGFSSKSRTARVAGVAEVARSKVLHALVGHAADSGTDSAPLLRASSDGRFIVCTSGAGVRFWDVACGQQIGCISTGNISRAVLHSKGTDLFTVGATGVLRWPIKSESEVIRIGPPQAMFPPSGGAFWDGCLSSDGRTLVFATSESQHGVLVFDLEHPGALRRIGPHEFIRYLALSPDNKLLATGAWKGESGGARIWRLETGDLVSELPISRNANVGFSPDGEWLVTSGDEHMVWRTSTLQVEARFLRHDYGDVPGPIAFSPDSTLLAATDSSAPPFKLMLVDLTRMERIATLEFPGNQTAPESLVFSADGTRLIFPNPKTAHVLCAWDLRAIREQLASMNLDWDLPPYAPAPPATDSPIPWRVEVDLGHLTPAPAGN